MIKINKIKNPINTPWDDGWKIAEDEKANGYTATTDYYNMYVAYLGHLIKNKKFTKDDSTLSSYKEFIKGYLNYFDEDYGKNLIKLNSYKFNPLITDSIRSLFFIKHNTDPYSYKGLNQNKYYTSLIIAALLNLKYIEKDNGNFILTSKGKMHTLQKESNFYKKYPDIIEYYYNYNGSNE